MDQGRSFERITIDDLARLGEIAAADRERFFDGRPEYRERIVCTAMCQGAALHYVDLDRGLFEPNGIKDFDVWTFFAEIPGERFPADRRMTHVDLGPSKFGQWDGEPERFRRFKGRRVDLLMRSLPGSIDSDPMIALRCYLRAARTSSAKQLAGKAAVLIDPASRRGEIAWPETFA